MRKINHRYYANFSYGSFSILHTFHMGLPPIQTRSFEYTLFASSTVHCFYSGLNDQKRDCAHPPKISLNFFTFTYFFYTFESLSSKTAGVCFFVSSDGLAG